MIAVCFRGADCCLFSPNIANWSNASLLIEYRAILLLLLCDTWPRKGVAYLNSPYHRMYTELIRDMQRDFL